MSRFVGRSIIVIAIALAITRPAFAQSFNPLYPPNSSQTLYAVCYDQYGYYVPYCDVTTFTGVYLYTNSHYHDSINHPFSSVNPASGNTDCCGLPIQVTTTIVGQAETVGACAVDTGLCSWMDFGVGYNLAFNGDTSSLWYLNGQTPNHGSVYENHWGTIDMINGINNTAYVFLQAHPEVGQIALNDQGLRWGGKFDIYSTWTSPHGDHDQGRAVDVNLVPQVNADEFVSDCYSDGATYAIVEYTPYNIHCRW